MSSGKHVSGATAKGLENVNCILYNILESIKPDRVFSIQCQYFYGFYKKCFLYLYLMRTVYIYYLYII